MLFENDEIVAVDKPYGLDSHTNESKAGQAEFVRPGLIELYEKQLGIPLHIVHRLDRTTTGVIVFAKTLEAAKTYQGYFRARETKKTYSFLTAAASKMDQGSCEKPILRNGDELAASTSFHVGERASGVELWTAFPKTGRNHQIRIHAAAVGLPLLGDKKYGGAPFPFICLHHRRIEFPNGVLIESLPPAYFRDLALLKNLDLAKALHEIDKRERLFSRRSVGQVPFNLQTQCLRLIHRASGEEKTLSLDQFGPQLVMSWYPSNWGEAERVTYEQLANILEKPILVRMMSKKAPEAVGREISFAGQEGVRSWISQEGMLKHELRTDAGQAVGLFLDQRLQRKWVLESSVGKTVLNLFAYTCGFSVAAGLGGAIGVTSVDSNKNMLNWGRRNFELNGLDPAAATFLCRDALTYLDQAKSKSQKFDLIICDPPAFSRGDTGLFKIENELEDLIKGCLEILSERGRLLFSTNADALFVDDIRKAILQIQKDLKIKNLEITSLQPSLDFQAPDEKPSLKSLLIERSPDAN